MRNLIIPRRGFIGLVAVGLTSCATGSLRTVDLTPTPAQTEGPFYPDKIPLDQDNDLVLVKGRMDPAKGIVTHLTGRVLDAQGKRNYSETSGTFCSSAPRGAQFSACFRDEVGERWYQVCFLEPVAEVGKE